MKHIGKVTTAALTSGALALAVAPAAGALTDEYTATFRISCDSHYVGDFGKSWVTIDETGRTTPLDGQLTRDQRRASLTFTPPSESGDYRIEVRDGSGELAADYCWETITVNDDGSVERTGPEREPIDEDGPYEFGNNWGDFSRTPTTATRDGLVTLPENCYPEEGQTVTLFDPEDEEYENTYFISDAFGAVEGDTLNFNKEIKPGTYVLSYFHPGPWSGAYAECAIVTVPGEEINDNDDEGNGETGTDRSSAGLLLPALLLIGSSYWFLNQDGSTYVSSEDRIHKTPTEEEKAVTDKLLEDNADEVIKQAEATPDEHTAEHAKPVADTPAGKDGHDAAVHADHDDAAHDDERGISANTGSNAFAVGLASLAFAGLIGAAAFAARRFLA